MKHKYILCDDLYIWYGGKKLFKIKSLIDFNDVKAGDLGGFIENGDNLDHNDTCWIYDSAKVCDNAGVYNDAQVRHEAAVCDSAVVSGAAIISERAHVYGDSHVYDYAQISGHARICDDVHVHGMAKISGNAHLREDVDIAGGTFKGDRILRYLNPILPKTSQQESKTNPSKEKIKFVVGRQYVVRNLYDDSAKSIHPGKCHVIRIDALSLNGKAARCLRRITDSGVATEYWFAVDDITIVDILPE